MKKLILLIALSVLTMSCTENQVAKQFGGDIKVNLNPGERLVNVTWKEDNMWILTRPRTKDEQPTSYTFREKSNLGLVEGTVTITEK